MTEADGVIVVSQYMRVAAPRCRTATRRAICTCCPDRSVISGRCDARPARVPRIRRSSRTPDGSTPRRAWPPSSRPSPRAPRHDRSRSASPGSSRTSSTGLRAKSSSPAAVTSEPSPQRDLPRTPRLRRHRRAVPPVRHRRRPLPVAGAARRRRARGDGGRRRRRRGTSRRSRRRRRPGYNGLHAEPGDVTAWSRRPHRPPGPARPRRQAGPTGTPRRDTHRHGGSHPRAGPSRRQPRHHRAPHPRQDLIRRPGRCLTERRDRSREQTLRCRRHVMSTRRSNGHHLLHVIWPDSDRVHRRR